MIEKTLMFGAPTSFDSKDPEMIISWVNETLNCNVKHIAGLRNGSVWCQILHILYPKSLPIKKVLFDAWDEFDIIKNYKLISHVMKKHNLMKDLPVRYLMRGNYAETIKFGKWMKYLFETDYDGHWYDPEMERCQTTIECFTDSPRCALPMTGRSRAAQKKDETSPLVKASKKETTLDDIETLGSEDCVQQPEKRNMEQQTDNQNIVNLETYDICGSIFSESDSLVQTGFVRPFMTQSMPCHYPFRSYKKLVLGNSGSYTEANSSLNEQVSFWGKFSSNEPKSKRSSCSSMKTKNIHSSNLKIKNLQDSEQNEIKEQLPELYAMDLKPAKAEQSDNKKLHSVENLKWQAEPLQLVNQQKPVHPKKLKDLEKPVAPKKMEEPLLYSSFCSESEDKTFMKNKLLRELYVQKTRLQNDSFKLENITPNEISKEAIKKELLYQRARLQREQFKLANIMSMQRKGYKPRSQYTHRAKMVRTEPSTLNKNRYKRKTDIKDYLSSLCKQQGIDEDTTTMNDPDLPNVPKTNYNHIEDLNKLFVKVKISEKIEKFNVSPERSVISEREMLRSAVNVARYFEYSHPYHRSRFSMWDSSRSRATTITMPHMTDRQYDCDGSTVSTESSQGNIGGGGDCIKTKQPKVLKIEELSHLECVCRSYLEIKNARRVLKRQLLKQQTDNN